MRGARAPTARARGAEPRRADTRGMHTWAKGGSQLLKTSRKFPEIRTSVRPRGPDHSPRTRFHKPANSPHGFGRSWHIW